LGCWISAFYGLFLLGVCFETYEPFPSLIFQFLSGGHGKPRITETADTETADMGAGPVLANYNIQEWDSSSRKACVLPRPVIVEDQEYHQEKSPVFFCP
jgi:hypothetical protein